MNLKSFLLILFIAGIGACKKGIKEQPTPPPPADTPTVKVKVVNTMPYAMHFNCYASLEDYVNSTNPHFSIILTANDSTYFAVEPELYYYTDVYHDGYKWDNWQYEKFVNSRQSNKSPIILWPYTKGEGENVYIIRYQDLNHKTLNSFRYYYINNNDPITTWKPIGQGIYDAAVLRGWRDSAINADEQKLVLKIRKDFKVEISGYETPGIFSYHPTEDLGSFPGKSAFLLDESKNKRGSISMDLGYPHRTTKDTCFLYYGSKNPYRRYIMVRQP